MSTLRGPRRAIAAAVVGALAAISTAGADAPVQPELNSPAGEVSIIRDRWGMAHLYAAREQDGFWGLGYATGKDRLLAVLLYYRAVRGELAAAFGRAPIPTSPGLNKSGEDVLIPDPVASDLRALRGRFLADARRNFAQLSPQLQEDMRSYIRGLKQYMAEHPQRVPEWAPELEPALPLALFAMQLFAPNENVCLSKLEPSDDPGTTAAARDAGSAFGQVLRGSNAWVLGGRRTASSKVIFGADSHGLIEAGVGSLFYPWRMRAQDIDVFALELTGTAVALFGHTRHYAWGWTEGPRQTNECVRVATHERDRRVYDVNGRATRMKVIPYEIRVKGESAVTGEFEYLDEDGVLSAIVHRDQQAAYAVRFSYTGRAGFAPEQHRKLVLARTPDSVRDVLGSLELYPANLLIGGADGTLAYVRPGRIARRAAGFDSRQFTNGNSSASAWHGFHPLTQLVQLWNPPQAYLVNDNVSPESLFSNKRVLHAKDYPDYFMMQPGLTDTRQERHNELFSRAHDVTMIDAQEITFDNTLSIAKSWAHYAAEVVPHGVSGDGSDEMSADEADLAAIAADLAEFDGRFASDSSGALYTALLLEAVSTNVEPPLRLQMVQRIEAGMPLSSDGQQALQSAVLTVQHELKSRCGTVLKNFGDVFRIGRGPVRAASSGIDIRMTTWPERDWKGGLQVLQFASTHSNFYSKWQDGCRRDRIGGTRAPMLVSFSEPIQSYSMQVFGVSDDPDSPHFSDQSLLASRRQLKSNFFDAAELRKNMTRLTRRRTARK